MRCLTTLLLLAGIVAAAPKGPGAVKNPQVAVDIAKTRGKLIFLTVIIDNEPENRAVIDAVFRHKPFLKIAPEFVIVYANKDDDHGKVNVRGPDGKPTRRCADCPNIKCLDHMLLATNWARGFFPSSEAKTPIHFVLNAEEEVVATIMNGNFKDGMNHVSGKRVVAELKKILAKHGRGLSEKQYAEMQKLVIDAKAARARRNVALEIEKLNRIVGFERDVIDVKNARQRLREIEKQGAAELAKVDLIIDRQEWENALDELGRIQRTYKGTLSAAAAKKRDLELQREKPVKSILSARRLFDAGKKAMERKKLTLAIKKFEQIVRRYPDTKYGRLAKEELAKLKPSGG